MREATTVTDQENLCDPGAHEGVRSKNVRQHLTSREELRSMPHPKPSPVGRVPVPGRLCDPAEDLIDMLTDELIDQIGQCEVPTDTEQDSREEMRISIGIVVTDSSASKARSRRPPA